MKTSVVFLSMAIVAICVIGNNAQNKLPSSWNRCSCEISDDMKYYITICEKEKTFDTIRDCMLEELEVYDGNGDTDPDVSVAKNIVDDFQATDEQKESLKKSLDSCKAQSKNRPEDNRTCVYTILMRRCASKPCPPKDK